MPRVESGYWDCNHNFMIRDRIAYKVDDKSVYLRSCVDYAKFKQKDSV
jgi:hypothetical protein